MGIVADLKDEFLINNPDYTNDVNNFIDYVSLCISTFGFLQKTIVI